MWKIRLVFKGAGVIHLHSSTEPKIIVNAFGQRTGLDCALIKTPDADWTELRDIDWGAKDLVISWRGSVDDFPRGKRATPRVKSPLVGDAALQARIQALVGRTASMSETEVARQLDEPLACVKDNITAMLGSKQLRLAPGTTRKARNRCVRR